MTLMFLSEIENCGLQELYIERKCNNRYRVYKKKQMAKTRLNTVRDKIFWSYAGLAMAREAVTQRKDHYDYSIRESQFKKLLKKDNCIRDFVEDEKEKLQTGLICHFCGSPDASTTDHIFCQKLKGPGTADNLLPACKKCNSSKGRKDFFKWNEYRLALGESYLPLMIIQRYLKLVYFYCSAHNYLDLSIKEFIDLQNDSSNDIPFKLDMLPEKYPPPIELKLRVEPRK